MIDDAVLDDAKRLVASLRAHGDEHNALVVEHLIVASGAPPTSSAAIPRPDHLSFRQAARVLNLRVQTIKSWVATGKVRAVVEDGEAHVDRSSLLAYLDGLRAARAPSLSRLAEETTRQKLLSLAYPDDILQRLRDLLDARQKRSLSAEEREELNRLEEVTHRVSAARLRDWLRQRDSSTSSEVGQKSESVSSVPPEG